MIVAIDGPAASGKSITAKLLADKLNFIHLKGNNKIKIISNAQNTIRQKFLLNKQINEMIGFYQKSLKNNLDNQD